MSIGSSAARWIVGANVVVVVIVVISVTGDVSEARECAAGIGRDDLPNPMCGVGYFIAGGKVALGLVVLAAGNLIAALVLARRRRQEGAEPPRTTDAVAPRDGDR